MPQTSGNNFLVLDTSNDTYTTIGSTSEIYADPIITSSGIIYANVDSNNTKFLKIDTSTDTVTEVVPAISVSGGGRFVDANNGFLYLLSGIDDSVYKLDLATDNIVDLGFTGYYGSGAGTNNPITNVDANGLIYSIAPKYSSPPPNQYRLNVIDTTVDSFNRYDVGLADDVLVRDCSLLPDGNIVGYNENGQVIKIDTASYTYTTFVTISDNYWQAEFIDNSLWLVPFNAASSTFAEVIFSYGTQLNTTQTSFLSGGLSGWIAPSCSTSTNPNDDPIVTQSIAILPRPRRSTTTVFDADFLKSCCYFSPVFAHPIDTDNFKNDFNSFLFERTYASDTIDLILLKNGGVANGGSDIPLIDNTYGTLYDYGFFGSTNKKGYKIDWRNVLLIQGTGTYQLQVNITSFARS